MSFDRSHSPNLQLSHGQVVSMFANAGDCFHVITGTLRISEAPRWLAEHMVAHEVDLIRGASYVVQQSGWLKLAAHEATTLQSIRRTQAEGPLWGRNTSRAAVRGNFKQAGENDA